jgi:hypothetical protein
MSLSSAAESPSRHAPSNCVTCSCAEEGIYLPEIKTEQPEKDEAKRKPAWWV